MITVLITGGEGQLGKCIQERAITVSGYDFQFLDLTELDITNVDQVSSVFNQLKPSFCINCAAYTNVDQAEVEPEKCMQINADGVRNLVEACLETKCRLIQISTDFVFDGLKTLPYIERDIPNPLSVYGRSKLIAEQIITEQLPYYFVVRTSWLYSEYGSNFVKTMIRLGKYPELSVVKDQIGSPTYAGDLADFLLILIMEKSWKSGIYHYSNIGEISWYDFACEIFEYLGKKIKICAITSIEFGAKATRPAYSVLRSENIPQRYFQPWKKSLYHCLDRLVNTSENVN